MARTARSAARRHRAAERRLDLLIAAADMPSGELRDRA